MDNMDLSLSAPQEDEFALCATTLMSPCMAMVFPRQREKFERYLTLRGLSEGEMRVWREAFLLFLRKLQWRYGRPLVLKSPTHTARVRLLAALFPGARFVHIHRNPYPVFLSTRRTLRIVCQWNGLQRLCLDELDDWVLGQYAQMYDRFLEERASIPKGCFHEVAFEALEQDPVGEVAALYRALDLPDFAVVEPSLQKHVGSLKGYRKNVLPELGPELRARIAHEWKPYFREWGYAA